MISSVVLLCFGPLDLSKWSLEELGVVECESVDSVAFFGPTGLWIGEVRLVLEALAI